MKLKNWKNKIEIDNPLKKSDQKFWRVEENPQKIIHLPT